jgi:KDO2-lipid IV(A) lauroyltransferase
MNQADPKPAPDAMPFARRVRYWLETAGFFLVLGFFRLFGIDRASAVGGWIGRNLVAPMRMSRRARANLRDAFPEKSDAEIDAILRGMWDNLGRVMAEYAYLGRIRGTGPDPRIEMVGTEYLDAAMKCGTGVLLFTGHFANWEIMPFGITDYGVRSSAVVRPPNNPYVRRWIEAVRAGSGILEQIPKGAQGTRRIFALLRKGEKVCVLADQRTSEGILVPFFGREAQTTPAPAALALKLGIPIVPVANERLGGARFRMRAYPFIEPVHTGDHERDILETTAAINAFIEARIREHPEQWLWIHKRWVSGNAPVGKQRAQTLSPGRGGTSSATSNRV